MRVTRDRIGNVSLITTRLISRILEDYALRPDGIHGVAHWARVLENGRRLAESVEANAAVIELFAVFHDARRVNDGWDHGHGRRGAELARQLRGEYFTLSESQFSLLEYACREHTSGKCKADPTVQVCWDADRLDLLRVGTHPSPALLCTEAARATEVLQWANRRAAILAVPELMANEWRFPGE